MFADVFASKLTTDGITRYAGLRQEEGAANTTINRELAVLRRMLNLGRRSTPPKVREVPYIPMLKEDNVRRGFVEDGKFSRLAVPESVIMDAGGWKTPRCFVGTRSSAVLISALRWSYLSGRGPRIALK